MDRDHMTLTQPPDIYTTGSCALPVPSGWSAKIFFSHSHGHGFSTLHKFRKHFSTIFRIGNDSFSSLFQTGLRDSSEQGCASIRESHD